VLVPVLVPVLVLALEATARALALPVQLQTVAIPRTPPQRRPSVHLWSLWATPRACQTKTCARETTR